MADQDEQDVESPRQNARRRRKEAGNRSARVARALMELRPPALKKLKLNEEIREATERARATKTMGARRREERRLAGVLRALDLADVEAQLEEEAKSGRADAKMFQCAEAWRERLIEEGQPAIDALHAELVGLEMERWQELVENAQYEKTKGSPKGAAKTLFRAIMTALRAEEV
jgi:ribosome-associated protein